MSVKGTLAALDREIARAARPARPAETNPAGELGRKARRNPALHCDMVAGCNRPVAAVDEKGFVYCDAHGTARRDSGIRCRKMRPSEIATLEQGGTISYRVRRSPSGTHGLAARDRARLRAKFDAGFQWVGESKLGPGGAYLRRDGLAVAALEPGVNGWMGYAVDPAGFAAEQVRSFPSREAAQAHAERSAGWTP